MSPLPDTSSHNQRIAARHEADAKSLEEAFACLAGAVVGKAMTEALRRDFLVTRSAVDEILRYYKVTASEVPQNITELDDILEYLLHPVGIMRRAVNLEKGWYHHATSAFLAMRKEGGGVVALTPRKRGGYQFRDEVMDNYVRVGQKNAHLFCEEAVAFYRPLPQRALSFGDVMGYAVRCLSVSDVAYFIAVALVVTGLGLLYPLISDLLLRDVVDIGSWSNFMATACFLVAVAISSTIFEELRSLFEHRMEQKVGTSLEAAAMTRVLSLPASFFGTTSAGDLASRLQNLGTMVTSLVSLVFGTGIASLFSLAYVVQIAAIAPQLAVPSFVIVLLLATVTVLGTVASVRNARKIMKANAKKVGFEYALLSGLQKIKLCGAQDRAFVQWAPLYSEKVRLTYNPPLIARYGIVFTTGISLWGLIAIYVYAIGAEVSTPTYYAFSIAFGMTVGAFTNLAALVPSIASIKPTLDLLKPFFDATPEVEARKQVISNIQGEIVLSHVDFRYDSTKGLLFSDLSVHVERGEYVAVVGKSGCGKSTLLRLLLGFEQPTGGSILYDGIDMRSVDVRSLRKCMGVVLQEGSLIAGSIYDNIVIAAPSLTVADAWRAAEIAGIADYIRSLPMGMHTHITEGSGSVSGGQRQRLMIARAVASKPHVLLLDEATSALDNITQKEVTESLASLDCTRIVVAHRLSTIKQCDRILVLDQGCIAESGTYEELIAKQGLFKELVSHQMLDS